MPASWIWLGLTIVLEMPVHGVAFKEKGFFRSSLACVLINGLTHPLASWAVLDAGLNWYLAELAVLAVEILLIKSIWRCSWTKAAAVGFLANAITAGLGWLLSQLF